MNYAAIKYNDIANGPGVRTSLFVSGCTHRCPDCFNAEAWDFAAGRPFTPETAEAVIRSCDSPFVKGLSLLGGEPMEPENQGPLADFVRQFRAALPDKTIWCWSGYTLEQLLGRQPGRCRTEGTDAFLGLLDVLVDGPFLREQKDLTLRFRGSRNQRIIDLRKTLAAGTTVLWTDDPLFSSHALPRTRGQEARS